MSDEERSRTQLNKERKAAERALADLATRLVALPAKDLARLELEETVADEVDEARRMKSHAARDRQMRIVRRALRDSDPEGILQQLDDVPHHDAPSDPASAWVSAFTSEGDAALQRFLAEHERADRQRLRTLLRNVKNAEPAKAPKARKALLAAIRGAMDSG